jgi:hypothetical protein
MSVIDSATLIAKEAGNSTASNVPPWPSSEDHPKQRRPEDVELLLDTQGPEMQGGL